MSHLNIHVLCSYARWPVFCSVSLPGGPYCYIVHNKKLFIGSALHTTIIPILNLMWVPTTQL